MTEQKPKIRSVKFNVIMNMILTTSSFIFPLITVPYVSRVLGPRGMGAVAWAQTFVSYFSLVAMLGISAYGIREVARARNNPKELSAVVQELMVILLISTTIVSIVFLICIFTVPKAHEDVGLMLIFGVNLWLSAFGVNWFYQGIEQYGYITIRSLVFKVLGLVLMFLFVRHATDYRIYAAITVLGSAGSNILNTIRLHKYVHFSFHRNLNLRRHFKPMMSFTISSISSGMYGQLDMLFLGFFGTSIQVGLYQLVVKIKNLAGNAVNSVGSVMLPRLSYYESQEGGHKKTAALIAKNINFLFITGIAFIGGIIICAQPLILILGGKEYIGATHALIIASAGILFSPMNTVLSQYMIAAGQEKMYAGINFLGLVLGTLYCVALIPLFGIEGAAIAYVGSELSTLIVRLIVLRHFIKELASMLDLGKSFLAFTIAFATGFTISRTVLNMNMFFQLIIGSISFGIPYLILLILLKESFAVSILNSLLNKHGHKTLNVK